MTTTQAVNPHDEPRPRIRVTAITGAVVGILVFTWVWSYLDAGGQLDPYLWVEYLLKICVALIVFCAAGAAGRWFFPPAEASRGALLVGLGALYAIDPYAFGGMGGDANLGVFYAWQVAATGASVACLFTAAALLRRHEHRLALTVLLVELGWMLAVNAIYVRRDGYPLRAYVGFGASPLPILSVAAGLGIRGILLLSLAQTAGTRAKA